MFRLKILKQLNGRKREEVRELENACRIHDHIEGGVLLAGDEGREGKPIFFLCYHNDFLAGFAMMHQIGDGAAEVCSYVHPEYRRNSLLKRLLKAARKEALNNEITTMNYMIEPHQSEVIDQMVQERYFEYINSEYLMEWKYSYPLQKTNELEVYALDERWHEDAARLLAGLFSMNFQEAKQRIQQFEVDGCEYYGAWQKEVLVGVFCLLKGQESVYIFDFAVDGDYQKRGIGKTMLKELIRIVQKEAQDANTEQKKIRIQTGSNNGTAFRLYQKNGFQVISQRDYYRINFIGI